MIVAVSCKAAYLINNEELNFPLVLSAISEHFLKFRSSGSFCRLAFVYENLVCFNAMVLAICETGFSLGGKAFSKNLFFCAYSAINDSSHRFYSLLREW